MKFLYKFGIIYLILSICIVLYFSRDTKKKVVNNCFDETRQERTHMYGKSICDETETGMLMGKEYTTCVIKNGNKEYYQCYFN